MAGDVKTALAHVNSEGGPLIISDLERVNVWNGATSPEQYSLACSAISERDLATIRIGQVELALWDPGGPGTTFLIKRDSGLVYLVRFWANDELTDLQIAGLVDGVPPLSAEASLDVVSGQLLIIWAAEDCSSLSPPSADSGIPRDNLSMGRTAFVMSVLPGKYTVGVSKYMKNDIEVKLAELRKQPLIETSV